MLCAIDPALVILCFDNKDAVRRYDYMVYLGRVGSILKVYIVKQIVVTRKG